MPDQPESAKIAAARDWTRVLRDYREPRAGRSVFELAVTLVPFALLWAAMLALLDVGLWWLGAVLALPAAGLLVRLFMIAHDCGHGSFFPVRWANDWTGRVLGVLTLTPYDHWRRAHAIHHAGSGNLDRRGIGDVTTLTVREYAALSRFGRLRYRLYRHPAVMFGLGPPYLFLLQHRLPLGFMRKGWTPWLSAMSTNAAILAAAGLLMWAFGVGPVLAVHLPIVLIGAAIGVWLFYVQHQFEGTRWDGAEAWNVHAAALHGSSHYDLPAPLAWFTANIGVHQVHHLASRIPCYRLPEVLRDFPELRAVGRLTLLRSLACVRFALWDEGERRLVSFREARARRPAEAGAALGHAENSPHDPLPLSPAGQPRAAPPNAAAA